MKPRKPKLLPVAKATNLMHQRSRCLAMMHTVRGPAWFIIPGGEVSPETAEAIKQMPNVVAGKDALFPNLQGQTWRVR